MVLATPITGFSIFLDFQLQDMYTSPSLDNLDVDYVLYTPSSQWIGSSHFITRISP
jgi:hypothetical protein